MVTTICLHGHYILVSTKIITWLWFHFAIKKFMFFYIYMLRGKLISFSIYIFSQKLRNMYCFCVNIHIIYAFIIVHNGYICSAFWYQIILVITASSIGQKWNSAVSSSHNLCLSIGGKLDCSANDNLTSWFWISLSLIRFSLSYKHLFKRQYVLPAIY